MAYNSVFTGEQIDAAISGINATATYSNSIVSIEAPDSSNRLTFISPSDFNSNDTYQVNGVSVDLYDLNNEPVEDGWKANVPITFILNGNKVFFKAGGSGKNDTLPPLLGNMTVEVVEGEETDTYTIKMDKLILDKTTEMVGGAQLEWGEEMPVKPGKGTGGIKTWTRDEVITTGKPYDGLYLGDVTPSDAVNETIIWLPENDSGKVKLVPFLVLSVDYLGGVYVSRNWLWNQSQYLPSGTGYDGSALDTLMETTYGNSVLHESVRSQIMECDYPVMTRSGLSSVKRKIVSPSIGELSYSSVDDGTAMTRWTTENGRICRTEDGTAQIYWSRSEATNTFVYMITATGVVSSEANTLSRYTRPSFVLPKDFKIQKRPDGSYTVWNEQGLMKLGDAEVGREVNVYEVSSMEPAIFVQNGYNGADAAVTVRKYVTEPYFAYGSSPTYAGSTAYSKIQSYIASLNKSVRDSLVEVDVKSFNTGTNQLSTVKTKGADLGVEELGYPTSDWGTGARIEYFKTDAERKATSKSGTSNAYWLKDRPGSGSVYAVGTTGGLATPGEATLYYQRPMLFFNPKTPIRQLADGSYDLVLEDPALATQGISTMAETGTPVQLKDIPVSTADNPVMLKIPETGTEMAYLHLRTNYDGVTGCSALLRMTCAQATPFNSGTPVGGAIPYENSTLDQVAQNFESVLDPSVAKFLVETDVFIGTSSSGTTLKRKIATPSEKELGFNHGSLYPEGTAFEYFNNNESRVSDPAEQYWTRSTNMSAASSNYVVAVSSTGSAPYISQTNSTTKLRPMLFLSGDTVFTDNGDGTYTFLGDEPASSDFVSHTVTVPHGQKVVFRQFTQNQKKQFQTMLVGGVYPPLGDVEPPFKLPEFTGNHAIFGDEVAGRIELYESGDLTLSPGTYDIFLVGGGGAGYKGRYSEYSDSTGGGGAGGKTFTQKAVTVPKLTVCPALVGAGGSQSGITVNDSNFSAQAGGGANQSKGGSGGSGGGGGGEERGNVHGGSGGSDGSNGADGYSKTEYHKGGTGQGTTTKSFGEVGGTLYAGGGGGGACSGSGAGAAGGGGGGGNGGNGSSSSGPGTAGTANTGGGGGGGADRYNSPGGAGGSGIIIVRWNNAAQ